MEDCNQICYKDPVLKDQQWSAYIDRSPGAASYSEVSSILAHVPFTFHIRESWLQLSLWCFLTNNGFSLIIFFMFGSAILKERFLHVDCYVIVRGKVFEWKVLGLIRTIGTKYWTVAFGFCLPMSELQVDCVWCLNCFNRISQLIFLAASVIRFQPWYLENNGKEWLLSGQLRHACGF